MDKALLIHKIHKDQLLEVSYEEFHNSVVGELNCHPHIAATNSPYVSIWEMLDYSRKPIGVTEDYLPEGSGLTKSRYYKMLQGAAK